MCVEFSILGILPVAGYALAKAILGLTCMGTLAVIAICSDDDTDDEDVEEDQGE